MSKMRWLALIAGLVVLGGAPVLPTAQAASDAPLARAPDGRPLVLTFADDFDTLNLLRPDGAPGRAGWRTTFGAGGSSGLEVRTLKPNGEMQIYVDPTMTDGRGRPLGLQPFSVHDGILDIVGDKTRPTQAALLGQYPYTSGLITSQPTFSQTYGYFEARVKLPAGRGLWPAIWLLPADQSWPPEIDIMESVGDPLKAYVTVHTATMQTKGLEIHPGTEGFHTYAVAWDPQQIVSYLDGVEVQRSPTPADMHKPMYILANLAIGGHWPGAPDAMTAFPAKFSIDFIRAYRFAG